MRPAGQRRSFRSSYATSIVRRRRAGALARTDRAVNCAIDRPVTGAGDAMPGDNSKKRLAGQLPHEEAAPITPLGEVVARDRADLDLGAGQESALAGRDRPPGVGAGEAADRARAAPAGRRPDAVRGAGQPDRDPLLD